MGHERWGMGSTPLLYNNHTYHTFTNSFKPMSLMVENAIKCDKSTIHVGYQLQNSPTHIYACKCIKHVYIQTLYQTWSV
jgi:hypothetical protein